MKGHSSIVKKEKEREKSFGREEIWNWQKSRARLPRLVKQQLEPRNPFHRFLRAEAASKATTTTFHGQKFYDRARTATSVYTYSSNVESVFAHLRLDEGRLTDYKSARVTRIPSGTNRSPNDKDSSL